MTLQQPTPELHIHTTLNDCPSGKWSATHRADESRLRHVLGTREWALKQPSFGICLSPLAPAGVVAVSRLKNKHFSEAVSTPPKFQQAHHGSTTRCACFDAPSVRDKTYLLREGARFRSVMLSACCAVLLCRVACASTQPIVELSDVPRLPVTNDTATSAIALALQLDGGQWLDNDEVLAILDEQPSGTAVMMPNGDVVISIAPNAMPLHATRNSSHTRQLLERCSIYGRGSCHRDESHSDYEWDTRLSLQRTSDGYKSIASWGKVSVISAYTWPMGTNIDAIVTCQYTRTIRTKCPNFQDLISFMEYAWPCARQIRQMTRSVILRCTAGQITDPVL